MDNCWNLKNKVALLASTDYRQRVIATAYHHWGWVWAACWVEVQEVGVHTVRTDWSEVKARIFSPLGSPSPQTPLFNEEQEELIKQKSLQSSGSGGVHRYTCWRGRTAGLVWADRGSGWCQDWVDPWPCCQSCGDQSRTTASCSTPHPHLGHNGWNVPCHPEA